MNEPVKPAMPSDPCAPDRAPSAWLHGFAVATAIATGLLIVAGGLVTSHDAGMAVPDWPTTFGQNMFAFPYSGWVGGIFYEHGHRLIAASVGLMTIILALWIASAEDRKWMKVLGAIAVAAVIAQGVLGGLRVTQLARFLAVPHACLAQAFFCLTVALALFTSRRWRTDAPQVETTAGIGLRWIAVLATLAIYCQLILGALVRHSVSQAGLTIGPALYGHLGGALVVMVSVGWLGLRILAHHTERRALTVPCGVLLFLFIVQIGLGLGALVARVASEVRWPTGPVILFTTAHVTVGALLLAAAVVVTLRAFQGCIPAKSPMTVHPSAERVTS